MDASLTRSEPFSMTRQRAFGYAQATAKSTVILRLLSRRIQLHRTHGCFTDSFRAIQHDKTTGFRLRSGHSKINCHSESLDEESNFTGHMDASLTRSEPFSMTRQRAFGYAQATAKSTVILRFLSRRIQLHRTHGCFTDSPKSHSA
ncbi:hypothetical protein Ctha_0263 [Chloroherpeton thalassium ATCC 35110]|uniref:Uncharacterized protein n=1 Tax=Chloroherpeton thalassium (strain ATCC 35110 / GB-78) TaxID=517418 RepID=B3QTI8_CHLT3|nr:hypothetical protein Ctha_0263 [Chloroherpeton thalassium ATCC 35110]